AKGIIDHTKAYKALKPIADTFREQFYTEKLYHRIIAFGYLSLSRGVYIIMEWRFIDGAVNKTYQMAQFIGNSLRIFQNGKINYYNFVIYVGFTIILLLIISWR
ncbi:MAG: NADH-quinone oxidoreductase subunit L, partial [Hydrogenobacter sp.]